MNFNVENVEFKLTFCTQKIIIIFIISIKLITYGLK